jgi:hypothetical protein
MAKIVLAVAFTILICGFANATTLEITGLGYFSSLPLRDSFYGVSGPGFSATGVASGQVYVPGTSFGFGFGGGSIPPTVVNIAGFAPCLPASDFFFKLRPGHLGQ